MSLEPELVSIQHVVRTGDGGGGKTPAWASLPRQYAATRNYYRRTSLMQLEQGAHNAEGPGLLTDGKQFFTFEEAPFPAVSRGNHIVAADGSIWNVLFARQYDDTLQVDCESVS